MEAAQAAQAAAEVVETWAGDIVRKIVEIHPVFLDIVQLVPIPVTDMQQHPVAQAI
jgi:hypothetical protein